MSIEDSSNQTHRRTMLVAAFLAWMFAGLENSLFILIHRQMMLELLGPETPEKLITEWFAWFQSAFLFWSTRRSLRENSRDGVERCLLLNADTQLLFRPRCSADVGDEIYRVPWVWRSMAERSRVGF